MFYGQEITQIILATKDTMINAPTKNANERPLDSLLLLLL